MGRRKLTDHPDVKLRLPKELLEAIEFYSTGKEIDVGGTPQATYGVRSQLITRLLRQWAEQQRRLPDLVRQIHDATSSEEIALILAREMLLSPTHQAVSVLAQSRLRALAAQAVETKY